MKPRASDFVGAIVLTLVLFAMVAIMFISAAGDAERIHREERGEAAVVTWQLRGGSAPDRSTTGAG